MSLDPAGRSACATALIVHHRHNSQAVHGDDFVGLAAHRYDADIARESIGLGVLRGLLADSGGGSTDVEGTHGQLGAGLADGLRRDHADRFAAFHQAAGGQVAAVTGDAHDALGFAGEHRADLDALDTGRLNGRRQVFGDLLVDAHDAVAQRLDDSAGFDDRSLSSPGYTRRTTSFHAIGLSVTPTLCEPRTARLLPAQPGLTRRSRPVPGMPR